MAIPSELWPELAALFDEGLALASQERIDWLAGQERRRPDLMPYLRRLLAAHERPEGTDPLRAPPIELMAEALIQRRPDAAIAAGDMLGPYRLLALLGEGGMASVWLAEQTVAVRRRVALKVPHPGLEDPAATATRFEQERDFLAGLEHPHIARLYDAGVSEAGLPYLAMEWIEGLPITRYADERRLTVAARVALFGQVLQAVRFAHARLVIHRDIKPSNILVTADGEVKLLDFGIARLLGDALALEQGGDALRALTPEAASPEQLAGSMLTTPSDVYSLGVVLYELLCGQRPYRLDPAVIAGVPASLHAAVLAARIAPPSTVAIDTTSAERRGATPRKLREQLAGDLDAIVAKALMKRLGDRYDSAEALAGDLERWSSGRPVSARRASPGYLASCFVRRHSLVVLSGVAIAMALCTGLGIALWQAEHARQEARTAQAVQDFLVGLFNASDPQHAKGKDVSAKELLDRGSTRLESDLRDQPAVLARLHHEVGGIYIQLGSNPQARPHLEKSLALYRSLGMAGTEDAIEAEYNLAELLDEDMQFAPAREAALRCLALADRHFGPRNRWRLPVQNRLAWLEVQQGHAQAGADRLSAAIAEAEGIDGSSSIQLLKARTNLANAHLSLGQFALARDEFVRVLKDGQALPSYEITDSLVDRYNLARARFNLREFEQAEREFEVLVPTMDQHIGPQHDRTIKARALWAQTLAEIGRYGEAVEVQTTNLATARARAASDGDLVSIQEITLAKLLKAAMRPREGLPLAREALSFLDAKYAEPTWLTEISRRLLGELLLESGHIDEAVRILTAAEARSERIDSYSQSTNFADLLQAQASTLRVRAHPGDTEKALVLLERARGIYDEALGGGNTASLRCGVQIAWMRARRPGADAMTEERFLAAADAYESTLPAGHLGAAEIDWMRAEVGGRAGASDTLRLQAEGRDKEARRAWKAVLGSEMASPLTVLH